MSYHEMTYLDEIFFVSIVMALVGGCAWIWRGPRHPSAILQKGAAIAAFVAFYVSWPWRSLLFYKTAATHEGFSTTADAYIVGVAHEGLAMVLLSPVLLPAIVVPVLASSRSCILPIQREPTRRWIAVLAAVPAALMLWDQLAWMLYCVKYPHHVPTLLLAMVGAMLTVLWWYFAAALCPRKAASPR